MSARNYLEMAKSAKRPAPRCWPAGRRWGRLLNHAQELPQPALLVDITRIPELAAVSEEARGVTLQRDRHPRGHRGSHPWGATPGGFLARVAAGIAYRAVRKRGTIGGSLAHADPAADWLSPCLTGAQRGDRESPGPRGRRACRSRISSGRHGKRARSGYDARRQRALPKCLAGGAHALRLPQGSAARPASSPRPSAWRSPIRNAAPKLGWWRPARDGDPSSSTRPAAGIAMGNGHKRRKTVEAPDARPSVQAGAGSRGDRLRDHSHAHAFDGEPSHCVPSPPRQVRRRRIALTVNGKAGRARTWRRAPTSPTSCARSCCSPARIWAASTASAAPARWRSTARSRAPASPRP